MLRLPQLYLRHPPRRFAPDAGLTILELMVVLVIMSLIGSVVAVQVVGQLDRAKVDVAKLQLHQLENSLSLFQLDLRRFPTAQEGLAVLLKAPQEAADWRGPYVRNADALSDPWGRTVTYTVGEDGHYALGSLGADGRNGGDGAAADLAVTETN